MIVNDRTIFYGNMCAMNGLLFNLTSYENPCQEIVNERKIGAYFMLTIRAYYLFEFKGSFFYIYRILYFFVYKGQK